MSADILRRAAKTLREHAEKAQHSQPWCPKYTHWAVRHVERNVDLDVDCEEHGTDCGHFHLYDGRYVALMHPPVALALAVLLDDMADRVESHIYLQGDPDLCPCSEVDGWHPLTNVAREILREAPDA